MWGRAPCATPGKFGDCHPCVHLTLLNKPLRLPVDALFPNTDSDTVGFKKALIKPLSGGPLAWAETKYESAYGLFSLRWEKSDTGLKVDVKVPHNTTALLILPEAKAGTIGGVEFSPAEGGARAELGSGDYSFSYVP